MQRILCVLFKLSGQRKVATLASGEPIEMRHDYAEATLLTLSLSRLLYIADKRNKCKYLICMGQLAVSYLSLALMGLRTPVAYPLSQLTTRPIITYGTCKRVVDVGLKRDYTWTFIDTDIKQPILGAEFLIPYIIIYLLTYKVND